MENLSHMGFGTSGHVEAPDAAKTPEQVPPLLLIKVNLH